MTAFKKFTVIFIIVVAITASGWQIWFTAPGKNMPIRIGINPWMGYEFLYLAEQKGMFIEEGLNVKLLQYSSLEDVRSAFERGHVDGMTSTVAEVIQANAYGKRKAQVVLVADFSNGADVILAKPPITSMKGLRGKRVAAEKASLGMFMLARALEKSGMTLDDVEVFAYDQPGMHQAIKDGQVDVTVTYPPFSVQMEREGHLNTVFDSSMISGEVLDTISINEVLLTLDRKLAGAILRVWGKALAYAKAHPEESYALMAARENITAKEFEEALQKIHIVDVSEQSELMKPYGKLEQAIVFMSKILHRSGELDDPVTNPQAYIFRETR